MRLSLLDRGNEAHVLADRVRCPAGRRDFAPLGMQRI
jgi:hypothetical protein